LKLRLNFGHTATVQKHEGDTREKGSQSRSVLEQPVDRHPRQRVQVIGVIGKEMTGPRCHSGRKPRIADKAELALARRDPIAEGIGEMPDRATELALQ
jgi:hypothetical protein